MNAFSFEWEPKKATSNFAKHGVTFDEAKTVFLDEDALVIPDPDHSIIEERFIILGRSANARIFAVVHCFRKNESSIRIITARKAGTKEQLPYFTQQR